MSSRIDCVGRVRVRQGIPWCTSVVIRKSNLTFKLVTACKGYPPLEEEEISSFHIFIKLSFCMVLPCPQLTCWVAAVLAVLGCVGRAAATATSSEWLRARVSG